MSAPPPLVQPSKVARSLELQFRWLARELGAPKSQRFLRFLRLRCPPRTPEIARFPRQEKAMLHCDLRVRWKVASDLRFRAAISEPKTPSFCGISGDLAPSIRKSLAIAIVRFWCAKPESQFHWPLCRGLVRPRGGSGGSIPPFDCTGGGNVKGGEGEVRKQTHTHREERTRKCCTHPLATYC